MTYLEVADKKPSRSECGSDEAELCKLLVGW